MRAASVPRLILLSPGSSAGPLTDAENIETFSATVPDQSEHLAAFAKAFRATSLPGLVGVLDFKQPPELLSMWACMCLAALLQLEGCGLSSVQRVVLQRNSCPRDARRRN
jgi:hypothetical protein